LERGPCWVSVEFLCAPISRKGSGSTTTTITTVTFSLTISNPKARNIDRQSIIIDGVILYFSFIEYRFVSTFSLSISNAG